MRDITLPIAASSGKLHPYVSEYFQVRYLARVEAALAETLADQGGVCPADVAGKEIAACSR